MISQALRFGLVGIGATTIHLIVASALSLWILPLDVANRVAFCIALGAGFLGHTNFSFVGHATLQASALAKYLVVAIVGFFTNEKILAALLSTGVIQPLFALTLAIIAAAVVSFVFSKHWVFVSSSNKR